MEVERFSDGGAFLERAEPLLLVDEARHNLILGLAGTLRENPASYDEQHEWVVLDGGRPVAAALRTPPFNLALARPASDEALAALVEALAVEELPGVTAALPEADAFATRWAEMHPVAPRTTMRQHIYELDRVEPPPRQTGASRDATGADRELAVAWWSAFAEETRAGGPRPDRAEAAVDHRLAAATAGFRLWEDEGRVVSLASWGGQTPNGIRIGPVYTPPELRGRGYATALTAELSQRLLDAGHRFCFLYTDAANPTANAIYERIGYRQVCDSAEIAFDA